MLVLLSLCFVFLVDPGQCQRRNVAEDVILRFYNKDTLDNPVSFNITDPVPLIKAKKFNTGRTTVFYIHGYKERMNWGSIQTVIGTYIKRNRENIVLVDWMNMSDGSYLFNAAPNTHIVAKELALAIKKLIEEGVNRNDIHIVGHSLGAQIAGFTGREFDPKLPRLSLLDPALPGFYPGIHVTSEDADFVDAIHTDAGVYGTLVSTGTVDFWPNSGKRSQPGCPLTFPPFYPAPLSENDLCSHWKSWKYWSESLVNNFAFRATGCSLNRTPKSNPSLTNPVYMGVAASDKLTGNYCLKTGPKSPFGLGVGGI